MRSKTTLIKYLQATTAGFFFANTLPHLISGITGQMFPTPFGTPSGIGLSSPLTNVLWGLLNLILGYLLIHTSQLNLKKSKNISALFLGFTICTIICAIMFGNNPNL